MEKLSQLTLPTTLLDYHHPAIESLVTAKHWRRLDEYERIGAAYNFVRDEIAFGYNESDNRYASRILADGMGQCNTKSTLLMALLRALGIACRFHGFTIDKGLQRGAITGVAYWLAPKSIIHSWVEVWFNGRWINLEGFILDRTYLAALQTKFSSHVGAFSGYGAATPDLQNPAVDWCGTDTYIQRDGINHDFGLFDSPDDFYKIHGVNLSGLKQWLFRNIVRKWMNKKVSAIRETVIVADDRIASTGTGMQP